MSFLSTFNLSNRFIEIIRRFPVVLLFALFTTVALIILIDNNSGGFFRWPITGYIGFLAMLVWTLVKEAYQLNKKQFYIGTALMLFLIGIYYGMIPTDFQHKNICFWFFTVGLSIILHLLVALVPFIKTSDNTVFTKYNISVFIAWMQSALYSLIFYLALCLVILALDKLFDIQLNYIVYFKLFILVTGIIQISFFLSDFPDNFYDTEIPAAKSVFKIITSFIFIPITILYGIILYTYIFRLIFTSHVMVDWTFVMVIWYFVVGILAWLFAGYYDNTSDNALMSYFRKWFVPASGLPAILLVISLYKNIIEFGIEEEYYLSAACTAMIGSTIIYLLIIRPPDKRIIPMLLLLFSAIAFLGGPISVCKVPVYNQQKRLLSDLSRLGLIKDGVITIDTASTYQDTNNHISNKLYFLDSREALGFLKEFDKNNLIASPADSIIGYQMVELFRLNNYSYATKNDYWNTYFLNNKIIDIKGFERIIPLKSPNSNVNVAEYLSIDIDGQIQLFLSGVPSDKINISNDIYLLTQHLDGNGILEYMIGGHNIKIMVQSASGEKKEGRIKVTDIQALVFIRKKI